MFGKVINIDIISINESYILFYNIPCQVILTLYGNFMLSIIKYL